MKLEKLSIKEFKFFKLTTSNLKSVAGGKPRATQSNGGHSDFLDDCGTTTFSDGTKGPDTLVG